MQGNFVGKRNFKSLGLELEGALKLENCLLVGDFSMLSRLVGYKSKKDLLTHASHISIFERAH